MSRVGTKSGWSGNCVETISTATTLNPSDSGKVFLCTFTLTDSSSGAQIITTPLASQELAGFNCKFILSEAQAGDDAEEDIEIGNATDNMVAFITDPGSTAEKATMLYNATASYIHFDHTGAAGDVIELICDGTQWYAYGMTGVDGGMLTS